MFGSLEYDVLDEVKIGTGTHLRLVKTERGKTRIESWSPMTKQWNVLYRYNAEEAWAKWKKVEASIKPKKKKKRVKK